MTRYNPSDLGTGEQEDTAVKLLNYAYRHYPKIVLTDQPLTLGQARQITKRINFNQAITILHRANETGLLNQRRRGAYNIILQLIQNDTK